VNIFIHSIWVGGQEVSNATCSCGVGFTNQAIAGAQPTWSLAESLGSCTQPANWGLYNQWWSIHHASYQQLLWSGKPNLCLILSPTMIFSSYCSLQNYPPYHDVLYGIYPSTYTCKGKWNEHILGTEFQYLSLSSCKAKAMKWTNLLLLQTPKIYFIYIIVNYFSLLENKLDPKNYKVILMGDFNTLDFDWECSLSLPVITIPNLNEMLFTTLSSVTNKERWTTPNNNLLEFVFTNLGR